MSGAINFLIFYTLLLITVYFIEYSGSEQIIRGFNPNEQKTSGLNSISYVTLLSFEDWSNIISIFANIGRIIVNIAGLIINIGIFIVNLIGSIIDFSRVLFIQSDYKLINWFLLFPFGIIMTYIVIAISRGTTP